MVRLEISPIDQLPESDWDLPQDTIYVRLGCSGCTSSVCFSAKAKLGNITGIEKQEVHNVAALVGKATEIHRGGTFNSFTEDCAQPCPNADDIALTAEIINEEYGSTL